MCTAVCFPRGREAWDKGKLAKRQNTVFLFFITSQVKMFRIDKAPAVSSK